MKLSEQQKDVVRKKFSLYCIKTVHGEALNYLNELKKLREREICFSELMQEEWNQLSATDEIVEKSCFQVCNMEVQVNSAEICEALNALPERKREIILMSYFLDMTEQEIADCLNLVQSTVHYHKADSLKMLKKIME
ncbi:MAG: sigma-70 family RNA polymerase sigma factor [Hespellia sp.]|nr:sigma-70 family RNA polymerase sigma factor [Hespellia sp.]